jgi:hypothetical protein
MDSDILGNACGLEADWEGWISHAEGRECTKHTEYMHLGEVNVEAIVTHSTPLVLDVVDVALLYVEVNDPLVSISSSRVRIPLDLRQA